MLTDRQEKVFNFILDSVVRRDLPPTVREIMSRFGYASPNGVVCHLKALKRKGYIEWDPGVVRSIRIIGQKKRRGIPLLTLNEITASGGW